MRYEPLDKQEYIGNRGRFKELMAEGCVAIFNSNDVMPTNADGTMSFRQNNDLFYLCGVDQEESTLIIFPHASLAANREILFLRETSAEIAIWEGAKLTKEQAKARSGVATVMWNSEKDRVLNLLINESKGIYINTNEHARAKVEVETRDARFIKQLKHDYPAHAYHRSAPAMHRLRSIKSQAEVGQIQRACDLTQKGFERILSFIKPGVMEYEIEAELIHEFTRGKSKGFAYTPIIASGANACVLHYIDNNKECKDGDVILMDFAAEYGNYASDLTRSIPVNGRYTDRQKAVYNAVLRVMKTAINMLRPGILLADYHREVGVCMEKELIQLGLLNKKEVENQNPSAPLYRKFFMHGTSHFLGLDVHDVGLWSEPLKAGMVFTCEPGIYIPEEALGIRIENDILITANDPVDLMANIPIEAEHIEELMNST